MIRIRLWKQGYRHPIKAWRIERGNAWNAAKEVEDYIALEVKDDVALRVTVDEVTTAQEVERDFEKDWWQENKGTRNGPLLWAVKETIEALEGAEDLVQKRINAEKRG